MRSDKTAEFHVVFEAEKSTKNKEVCQKVVDW